MKVIETYIFPPSGLILYHMENGQWYSDGTNTMCLVEEAWALEQIRKRAR